MLWRPSTLASAVAPLAVGLAVGLAACESFSEESQETPPPSADGGPGVSSDATSRDDAAGPAELDAAASDAAPGNVLLDETFANRCTPLLTRKGLTLVPRPDGGCDLCRQGAESAQYAFATVPPVPSVTAYRAKLRMAASTNTPAKTIPGLRTVNPNGSVIGGSNVTAAQDLTSTDPVDVSLRLDRLADGGSLELYVELQPDSGCVHLTRMYLDYVR